MFKKNSFKITITSHIPSCLNGKNRSLNSKTLASDPYDVDDPVRNIVKPIKIVCICLELIWRRMLAKLKTYK